MGWGILMFWKEKNKLIYHYDAEELWIEPWGKNAFRIRATKDDMMPPEDWALMETIENDVQIEIREESASIKNGKIKAFISRFGKITIYNQKGDCLLEEYSRNRKDLLEEKCSALEIDAREFKSIVGGDYHLTWRLESICPNEKVYGMGQYQQPYLDLKGMDLEMAHRNSQASVPFSLSSLGYGI